MRSYMLKTLLLISLTLVTAHVLAATYSNAAITHAGNIIADDRIYLGDKTTLSYRVNWGDITINKAITQYRWICNNGTGAYVKWNHSAPNYLQVRTYYEQPAGVWRLWYPETLLNLPQGQWLHIKFELTALSDAIDHTGAFQFDTHFLVVELASTGDAAENRGTVYMKPSEVVFKWGTLKPGERRDIYHQKVAVLTANQRIRLTATLNIDSAIHFNVIGIWIQVGSEHYFLSKTTQSETWTIPAGVHDVYYDCTMIAKTGIIETASGEIITSLTYDSQIIGTFKIQYVISP